MKFQTAQHEFAMKANYLHSILYCIYNYLHSTVMVLGRKPLNDFTTKSLICEFHHVIFEMHFIS